MFQQLNTLPEDAILGLMAKFRADPFAQKVDLGVGVYRDAHGNTPILDCVSRAEREIQAAQTTKTYVAPAGRAEFNTAVERLVLGEAHAAIKDRRARTVQAPGGCGALRVGAELIRVAAPGVPVHVSEPTWGNHIPLLSGAGLKLDRYPYYDPASHTLRFEAMLDALDRYRAGDIVLLHACCHNPSGADLSQQQWRAVVDLLKRRSLVPFLDLAYQGLGEGIEADAYGVRLAASELPEALIAVSFSKNFGLYRERVGALIAVSENESRANAVQSHVLQIARSIYSMPPDHGAAIVARILADPAERGLWDRELGLMRERINAMRKLLSRALRDAKAEADFGFLETQRGMFSLLGVSADAVAQLRERHHVYMIADSRMNLAGVMPQNVEYLAGAISAVLKSGAIAA